MRQVSVKVITHSSGKNLPLLCIDNNTGETEWAIQAMPLLQQPLSVRAPIKACLTNVSTKGATVEKYFFDLPLSFNRAIADSNFKSIFITRGSLKLANLKTNETFVTVIYSGINAYPKMHAILYEHASLNEFLTNPSSSLHLINRFSFTHPDDPDVEKEFEFKMPFKDLFTLSNIDPESVVRYYLYEPEEMKYQPFVTLQKNREKIKSNDSSLTLLEKNGELENSNNMLFFNKACRAHTLINSDILANNLKTPSSIHNGLLLAELSVIKPNHRLDLPLNEEIKPGLYKDKQNADVVWYQDFLILAKPAPGATFFVSPFQFLFRVKGIDTQGKPVLESEITVTLICNLPIGASSFAATNLKRIPKKNVSVTISIPFMNNNGDNQVSNITSSSITQEDNTITARFILNNEWTRVAYAAMSSHDIISNSVKLKVSYLFNVYTKMTTNKINIVSLHKLDKLQIIKTLPRGFNPVTSVFVASQNTLLTPAGLSIKYETASVQPNQITAISHINVTNFVNTVPQNTNTVATNAEYKIDSLLYTNEMEVFLACNEYGEYYQEEKDGLLSPIGCKEPYKLGELTLRLYTEINELRTAKYRVLRSNQVPNRFVIVPARYIISRNGKDLPSPLAPDLILYSTFDVNNLTDSHSVLNAVLQPDIEYFVIVKLTKELQHYTSYVPDVLFINEIESAKTWEWSLPESLYISNNNVVIGNFINYSLVCQIDKTLTVINMLKSATQGINGVVHYTLPDGLSYDSTININIREVEGPWMDSPLLIKADAAGIEIENILDTVIDVAGLHVDQSASSVFDSLNISLAPKTKVTEALPGRSNIVPEYFVHPMEGNLEEVHSYSENIGCQLIFIDTSEKDISNFDNIKVLYSLADDTQYLSADLVVDNLPLEAILPIPLTKYLSERVIRYKIQATKKSDKTVVDTPWETVDLSTGNIINLTNQINTYFV